jgi:hypothetical protein
MDWVTRLGQILLFCQGPIFTYSSTPKILRMEFMRLWVKVEEKIQWVLRRSRGSRGQGVKGSRDQGVKGSRPRWTNKEKEEVLLCCYSYSLTYCSYCYRNTYCSYRYPTMLLLIVILSHIDVIIILLHIAVTVILYPTLKFAGLIFSSASSPSWSERCLNCFPQEFENLQKLG